MKTFHDQLRSIEERPTHDFRSGRLPGLPSSSAEFDEGRSNEAVVAALRGLAEGSRAISPFAILMTISALLSQGAGSTPIPFPRGSSFFPALVLAAAKSTPQLSDPGFLAHHPQPTAPLRHPDSGSEGEERSIRRDARDFRILKLMDRCVARLESTIDSGRFEESVRCLDRVVRLYQALQINAQSHAIPALDRCCGTLDLASRENSHRFTPLEKATFLCFHQFFASECLRIIEDRLVPVPT